MLAIFSTNLEEMLPNRIQMWRLVLVIRISLFPSWRWRPRAVFAVSLITKKIQIVMSTRPNVNQILAKSWPNHGQIFGNCLQNLLGFTNVAKNWRFFPEYYNFNLSAYQDNGPSKPFCHNYSAILSESALDFCTVPARSRLCREDLRELLCPHVHVLVNHDIRRSRVALLLRHRAHWDDAGVSLCN